MTERDETTSDHETPSSEGASARGQRGGDPSRWEWWVRSALGLAGLLAILWGIVGMGLGDTSLYVHVFGLPICGALTLPVALWGVMRTVFRPPVFRWRRGVGFVALLAVGILGNVPMFAVPLSTSEWTPDRAYRLPFEGQWYTLAGGPDVERNYHATTAPYRWGYDFTPLEEGKRYEGEGDSLESYYCYQRPVLAPVGGEVVQLEGELEDKPPGEFDSGSVLGNHVVLHVADGVYLFVAHLAQNSVEVDPGETVERGDQLGTCGNSGRALEPHVHVHLQDRLDFPVAQSLPLPFSHYRVNGEVVERGMPIGEGEGGTPEGEYVEYVGARP